jgi:hypothetical protein
VRWRELPPFHSISLPAALKARHEAPREGSRLFGRGSALRYGPQ